VYPAVEGRLRNVEFGRNFGDSAAATAGNCNQVALELKWEPFGHNSILPARALLAKAMSTKPGEGPFEADAGKAGRGQGATPATHAPHSGTTALAGKRGARVPRSLRRAGQHRPAAAFRSQVTLGSGSRRYGAVASATALTGHG
jgi:hypothetical protein